jgi:hypothetical protein
MLWNSVFFFPVESGEIFLILSSLFEGISMVLLEGASFY